MFTFVPEREAAMVVPTKVCLRFLESIEAVLAEEDDG